MKPVNKPSIYAIRHKESGKVYVGSAVKVLSRWGQHRSQLRKAKHHNPCLQAAWMLHGEAAFEFEVLDALRTPPALLTEKTFTSSASRPATGNLGTTCVRTLRAS